MRRRSEAGERFLVHGGSSGHGRQAIPAGTANSAHGLLPRAGQTAKCDACGKTGGRAAINYRDTDFVDVLKSEGRRGFYP